MFIICKVDCKNHQLEIINSEERTKEKALDVLVNILCEFEDDHRIVMQCDESMYVYEVVEGYVYGSTKTLKAIYSIHECKTLEDPEYEDFTPPPTPTAKDIKKAAFPHLSIKVAKENKKANWSKKK